MLFQRSTDNKFRWSRFALAGVLCVSVFAISRTGAGIVVSDTLASVTYEIAAPFWSMREALFSGTETMRSSFSSKMELVLENEALRTSLAEARRDASYTQALRSENDELRNLIGRLPWDDRAIVAGVVHGSQYSPYDMCVVDAGEIMGVRERMVVVAPDGSAVGVVAGSYPHYSAVAYFTSAGVRTDAILMHASGTTPIILYGKGAGTMLFNISREIDLAPGDTVLLPGFSRRMIGSVVYIEGSEEDAVRTAYVRPPAIQTELDRVWIDTTYTWSPAVVVNKDEGAIENVQTAPDDNHAQ